MTTLLPDQALKQLLVVGYGTLSAQVQGDHHSDHRHRLRGGQAEDELLVVVGHREPRGYVPLEVTAYPGHRVFAEYLLLVRFPQAAELTVFCGSLVGASLGFLWYNSYPAEIFMGDVGSLALGAALGIVAILIKQELLLPIVGGVFVLEALSVVLQVGYFKATGGQRLFRMAPLHHHFELIGWSEPKVITRFVIVGIIFALFSLATLKLR